MKIIGIAGKARSGKDTFCQMLIEELYPMRCTPVRFAFADPMKEGLAATFMLGYEELHGDRKELPIDDLCGKSPRQMLQWFGTDFARNMLGEDIWLRVADRHVKALSFDHSHIIIPDVRFNNEAQWIRDKGGLMVHIRRDEAVAVNDHASESGLIPTSQDAKISNNGSLDTLRSSARALIRSYGIQFRALKIGDSSVRVPAI